MDWANSTQESRAAWIESKQAEVDASKRKQVEDNQKWETYHASAVLAVQQACDAINNPLNELIADIRSM